jgi:hypothetical protein
MATEFSFSEEVRGLLLEAIKRFINLGNPTPRLYLRQKLKGKREILDQLIADGYLIERERENYVPGIMAFETCGDAFLLGFARDGTGIVLHTLQNLYEVNTPKTSFTLTEIKEHAEKLYDVIEEEKIPVGLSLVAELANNILAGWNPDGGVITSVHVREDILDFQNIDAFWSQAVQRRLALISGHSKGIADVIERPSVSTTTDLPDLSFMKDDRLRQVVRRDYAELRALNGKETTKSRLIMAGGILEGVLLDALVTCGKWTFDEGSQQYLKDMIGLARNEGVITEERLSDAIRKYRALVHPGREIREDVVFSEADAELACAAVDVVIREVRRWHSRRNPIVEKEHR